MQNANGVTMASFLGGELAHAHGEDAHGHGAGGDEHGEDEHAHEEDEHGHEDDHDNDMHADEDDDHEIEGGPGIGGRPIIAQDVRKLKDFVYLMRWENAFDLSDNLTAVFGASSLLGPNSSGPAGSTWIYGFDMKWRWQPANSFRGYPFLTWQTEYMRRHYEAAAASMEITEADGHVDTVTLPADTLEDWGMYTQLLYGPVRSIWRLACASSMPTVAASATTTVGATATRSATSATGCRRWSSGGRPSLSASACSTTTIMPPTWRITRIAYGWVSSGCTARTRRIVSRRPAEWETTKWYVCVP